MTTTTSKLSLKILVTSKQQEVREDSGSWWSRKHRESVFSPKQQRHWHNLSDVTISELWRLSKTYNFKGKVQMVHCVISVNLSS